MNDVPKKSLGQHWLRDELSLREMAAAAEVAAGDVVLEVGPGQGTLTTELLRRDAQVIAIEFDNALAEQLPGRVVANPGQLTVTYADILRYNFTELPVGYKVVANIPYYLTSNLLRLLCESTNPFSQAALLMQQEVAERVCAVPGKMSMLSVSVQYYCEASVGLIVPAALFDPAPKVDSQILILRHRSQPLFDDVDTKLFFRLVKAGFSQRRKTLTNSLAGGLQLDKASAIGILNAAGIKPTERAQALSLDEWHRLYQAWQLSLASA